MARGINEVWSQVQIPEETTIEEEWGQLNSCAEHACLQAAAKLAAKIPTPAGYRLKGTIPNNIPAQPRSFLNICMC